jgi:hypothetical protein
LFQVTGPQLPFAQLPGPPLYQLPTGPQLPFGPQPFGPQPPAAPGAGAAGAAGLTVAGTGGPPGCDCIMYIPRAGVLARGTGMFGISGGMSDASSLPRRSTVLAVG